MTRTLTGGRGIIPKRDILLKKLRDHLPEIGSEFPQCGIIYFQKFDSQPDGSEPTAYCLIRIVESQTPHFELATEGHFGIKCFLSKASRHQILQSRPDLATTPGSVKIFGIRITGVSNSKKSLKCELL